MLNNELKSSLLVCTTTLKWREKPNQPQFLQQFPNPEAIDLSLDLICHPCDCGRVVINYPGLNESSDGLNMRYRIIAYQMQSRKFGAMVRSSNLKSDYFLPSINLKKLIDYSITNSKLFCGSSQPEVLLMGFSAGAAAVAALASSYEQVSRILLIAPSGDMPQDIVKESLQKFAGEVFILIGENDEIVGVGAGQKYYDLASSASCRRLIITPNCDHNFSSEINDMIFKQVPFDAFVIR